MFGKTRQLGPYPWKWLEEWGLTHGELFHLKFGSEHFVYVNSWEGVREIFDRQSAKTSCKGPLHGANELVSNLRIAILPYGFRWRQMRSILNQLLHPNIALNFRPSRDFDAKQLISDLLEEGSKDITFKEQAHRMTLSSKWQSR